MTTAEVALEEGSRRKEAAVAGAADNDEHQTPRRRVKSERVKSERVEGHETRPSSERDVAGSRSSREKGEKVPNKASTADSEESSNKRSSIFGSIGYNSAHAREMKRAAKEAARKISGGAKVATFGTGKVARAAVFCCGRNLLSFRNFLIHGPFIGMAVAWVVGQSLQDLINQFTLSWVTPFFVLAFGGSNTNELYFTIANAQFAYAAFFNSLIAFIITLMVVWCCVLYPIFTMRRYFLTDEEKSMITCPECEGKVSKTARRCKHCTSFLSKEGSVPREWGPSSHRVNGENRPRTTAARKKGSLRKSYRSGSPSPSPPPLSEREEGEAAAASKGRGMNRKLRSSTFDDPNGRRTARSPDPIGEGKEEGIQGKLPPPIPLAVPAIPDTDGGGGGGGEGGGGGSGGDFEKGENKDARDGFNDAYGNNTFGDEHVQRDAWGDER